MSYRPMAPPPGTPNWDDGADLIHVGPPRVRFSGLEVVHLAVAVILLSYAFSIVLGSGSATPFVLDADDLTPHPMAILSAFLAVASGFVLHELAHKVVAQRYGHWAEFRAQFGALGFSVLFAAVVHAVIALPGAVLIQGRVTPRENGIISLVGPATNIVVALAFLPLFAFRVDQDGHLVRMFATVTVVNAVLAVFNLMPFGPLDGRKVWRWNPAVWIAAVVGALGLLVYALMQASFP